MSRRSMLWVRCHARRKKSVADHGLNKVAIAHAGKNDMSIYVCNPPHHEAVLLNIVELSPEEGDALQL